MSKNTALSFLGKLVCEIVGFDMNAAKATFSEYPESNNLDSWQIYFVNQMISTLSITER